MAVREESCRSKYACCLKMQWEKVKINSLVFMQNKIRTKKCNLWLDLHNQGGKKKTN